MTTVTEKAPVWASVTYTLLFPRPLEGDEQLGSLTFSEPDGEQLEQIDDIGLDEGATPKVKQIHQLISIMSRTPIENVRKMHAKDIKGATDAMSPLLEGAI